MAGILTDCISLNEQSHFFIFFLELFDFHQTLAVCITEISCGKDIHFLEIFLDQSARVSDVFCCFQFIAGEHPHFNIYSLAKDLTSFQEITYSLWNLILKSILDSRTSD